MFYITGDVHGKIIRLLDFCSKFNLIEEDVLIVLGDLGLNFYNNSTDKKNKKLLANCKNTFFCIHGNHEIRPQKILTYKTKEYKGGIVYYEEDYPNILFAKDGEIYNFEINNELKKVAVLGGAYSIDKYYRIANAFSYPGIFTEKEKNDFIAFYNKTINTKSIISKDEVHKIDLIIEKNLNDYLYNKFCWWNDEQMSIEDQSSFLNKIKNIDKIDIILSHTAPLKYEPREWFLSGLNQQFVDNSMEQFLDKVEESINYDKWYCGHYHGIKKIDKIQFMFEDYDTLN